MNETVGDPKPLLSPLRKVLQLPEEIHAGPGLLSGCLHDILHCAQMSCSIAADGGRGAMPASSSRSENRLTYHKDLIIAVAVFALLIILSLLFQKPISLNDNRGWDGLYYYDLAEDISAGRSPETRAPFAARIGLPFLVGTFFPSNLMLGFKVLNVIANMLVVILFVAWLRLFVRAWYVRALVVSVFMIAWHSPIRRVYYEAPNVDHWLLVFLFAGLIGVHLFFRWKPWVATAYLCVVSFLGALFREACILPALGLLFSHNPLPLSSRDCKFDWVLKRLPNAAMLLPITCGLAGLVVAHAATRETGDYSLLRTILHYAYTKAFPKYILAWFIAFGPLLVMIVLDARRLISFLLNYQYLLVALLAIAFWAYVGGSATYRLLLFATPIVFLLLAVAIEDQWTRLVRLPWFALALCVGQVLSQRVLWVIPDYPNDAPRVWPLLSPQGNNVRIFDVLGMSDDRVLLSVMLAQYLVFSLILIVYFLGISSRHEAGSNHSGSKKLRETGQSDA